MKKILFLFLGLLILAGCAEERKFIKNPLVKEDILLCQADGYSPFGGFYNNRSGSAIDRVTFPGFFVGEGDKGVVEVIRVIGADNIQKELRRGDRVVALDGVPVMGKKQYMSMVGGKRVEQVSVFTFRRMDNEFSIGIRLNEMYCPMMYTALADKLNDGKKVSIAIIPFANQATVSANVNASGLAESDKDMLSSSYEGMFINEMGIFPNFSVVDRKMIESIMKEVKFQVTGFVDEQTMAKIGKMTGATHLMSVTISRYEDGTNYVERLVEIETTNVVYSNNYTIKKPKPVVKKRDEDDERKWDKKDDKQP